jgi:RNA polymerase sigma factor (sigma-70 family)
MRRLSLDETALVAVESDENLLALDEALTRLAASDERAARIVELRYFGGLTDEEAAEVVGVSEATAKRDLRFARAWLSTALGVGDG